MGMVQGKKPLDYSDGMTKQSFKDETDINKIVRKAQKAGTVSHLQKHGAFYGDFGDMPDLLDAYGRYQRGVDIFSELPSEVRKEFDQDMGAFFNYVNDPANKDRLPELLPGLAEPGRQLPAVRRSAATQEDPTKATAEDPPAAQGGDAPASPPPATDASSTT